MTLDELNSAVATATGKPKSEASKAVAPCCTASRTP